MATLTADITATQKVILVSGSTPDQGHFRIRIDDELMDVEGFDRKQLRGGYRDPGVDRTRWIVTRGVGGTTPTTHSAGDTLTATASALVSSDDLTPPLPFAGEGGVQTLRLLGPFHIAHDDVGLQVNGVKIADLAAGTWLWGVAVVVTQTFDGLEPGGVLEIGVEASTLVPTGNYRAGWGTTANLALTDQAAPAGVLRATELIAQFGAENSYFSPVGLESAVTGIVTCAFYPGGANTVGEADIYLLTAEPVA